jgi:transcriptional regulator with XRE-family HTH domain
MAIHIGQLIEARLDAMGITKSEFARRINRARQNVSDIINRPSVDTELLLLICNALEYDFFQYYSMELGEEGAVHDNPGAYVNMRTELRGALKRVDDMENDILRTRNELRMAYELNDMFREKIDQLKVENDHLRRQLGINGPTGDA